MKTKQLFRLSKIIILSIVIAVLMTSGLGGAQSVKGLSESAGSAQQRGATNLAQSSVCKVSAGGSIKAALNNTACTTITVHAGDYRSEGWYKLERSGVTLQADGKAIISMIIVYGNNNVVRGFTITDRTQKTGIRTYGDNNLIENNEIYDMAEDGMWLWGENNTIRGNYIHDIYDDRDWPSYDQHVDCWMTWSWQPAPGVDTVRNLVFENNICVLDRPHGSNQFFILTHNDNSVSITDITFRNNIFIAKDVGYVPIAFFGDSTITGMKVINNSFYNTSGKGEDAVWAENIRSSEISGNTIYGFSNAVRNINSQLTMSNNQLLPFTGLPQIVWPPAQTSPQAATPIPPTMTAIPPTMTAIPPTMTAIPPTMTAIPPTMTAISPTQPGNSPSLPGLSWEAEQGEITAPFVVANGVVLQNNLTTNPADGGRALYRFTIQDAGDYIVKSIVNAADAGSNSFFVGIDTEPDTSMIWDVLLTNGLEERTVSWREGAAPDGNASTTKLFTLAPGEHTIIIRGREANTFLDALEVVKTNTPSTPTVTATPPPTATQLSIETATPIPPTMTATPPVQIVNSASLPGLSWEAEQGEITTPFVAMNGVVSQSILTDNPANGGRALYRLTIKESGEYIVKATVNAADSGRNSFFVGMDIEPDIFMIWDVILTNGFEERTVSWREGATPDGNASTPKVFYLTPGEHTLIFRGREMSTLLDKVEVARIPVVQPTTTDTPTAPATQLPTQTPIITATPIPINTESLTSTPTTYTSTPLPTETPLPIFTAQPLDSVPPTITNINNHNYTQLQVTFSEDIGATGSDASNFSLIGAKGGQAVIDSISYDSNFYTTTLNINNGNPLPPDDYTLMVAGTTSITDLAGNKLDGNADGVGGDDFVHGFSIQAPTATPTETPIPASPTPTETPVPPTATATETPVPVVPTPTSTSELPPTEKPAEQPASETVYDDKDSVFVYSSGWQDVYRKWAYKGSVKETTRDGSSVTLNFTGQSFSILYKSGPEYRTLDVYVDDVLVGNISQRAWNQAFQQRWDYPGQLAPGPHTLKLVFVTPDKRNRTRDSLDAVIVR